MLLQVCVCALGEEKEILVEHDDGIRPDISAGALGKLKAVFKKDGTTTAGNSSQVQPLTSVVACLHKQCSLQVLGLCCTGQASSDLANPYQTLQVSPGDSDLASSYQTLQVSPGDQWTSLAYRGCLLCKKNVRRVFCWHKG